MTTNWGDLRVSDAHVHFFSHGFFRLLAEQRAGLTVESIGPALGWQMPPEDAGALADRWVEELDRHGVSKAALIASLPGDGASVSAAVGKHPSRFLGYYMVDPLKADASRIAGVPCLFPAMHRYSMADARVDSFLEALPGKTVFVHCGVLSVGVRKKLGLASPFDMRYSNPLDLHAVALKHAGLRFVVPHFGAGYWREALMLADMCPNVYLDTSSSNGWMKYEGLSLPVVLRRALDVAGPSRLLFGTDSSFFPRGWNRAVFDAQQAALVEVGVSRETAAAIFSGNLEGLL